MKILYVDPMSYNNLSIYDRYLLNNIIDVKKEYFCSTKLEFENFENTSIKKLYCYSEKKGILKILSYLWTQILLFLYVLKNDIDLIHIQWMKLPYLDYLIYRTIKRFLKVNIVFTAHNILPHDTGEKYKKSYKKIYNMIDKIIVHSSRTREELINEFEISREKISVIPHGLLDIQGEDSKKNDDFIKNKNEKVFSFIGYLNKYKGIDFLVDAWRSSELLKDNKNVKLIIAGKGNIDFKGLEDIENVTIINRFLEDFELNSIINETDLFILPYRKISQSGVLLSILNKRKAVLVSNEGGLTDPFEFGNIGWIMEEKSSKCLRENLEKIISGDGSKIKEILNDDIMWKKINAAYDWKDIGLKTKKLYEEVLK